jgi:hypothetical protein
MIGSKMRYGTLDPAQTERGTRHGAQPAPPVREMLEFTVFNCRGNAIEGYQQK